MDYGVYGPFNIKRVGDLVDKNKIALNAFWEAVDAEIGGLSGAVGCYVFCIGKTPWYVGMAERQSFRKECFSIHKQLTYGHCLAGSRGAPKLFLIPKLTKQGKFVRPTKTKHVATRFLESMLIGMALTQNTELANVKRTKFYKDLCVPGVINSKKAKGKRTSVQALRVALGT